MLAPGLSVWQRSIGMGEPAEPAEAGVANSGPEEFTVYVGNLPPQCSGEAELAGLFGNLAPPLNVKVMRDKATGV